MKHCCIGLLAHVDAGKTTLSESILYNTGAIRKAGRVDHGDSFFDSVKEERERGITIFSKQALFKLGEKSFTLIDTPGHVDFSAEMERALSVLDYAVLIISASDGLHGHDITLWRLLKAYNVPVIVFVNKMDQQGADKVRILKILNEKFGSGFVDFSSLKEDSISTADNTPENKAADIYKISAALSAEALEDIAVLDESAMDSFLEHGSIENGCIAGLISKRKLFPCCFGSALKNDGVNRLLSVLYSFTVPKAYGDSFAGRVYKITRDRTGRRIAHIKITGGTLRPKDIVAVHPLHKGSSNDTAAVSMPESSVGDADTVFEKAEQLLLFNGDSAEQLREAAAGMAVAVTGLDSAFAGAALGAEKSAGEHLLVPLFTSRITAPFDTDMHRLYLSLKELEEEIPEIELFYDSKSREINARLMGEVQTEILMELVKRRFGMDIGFGKPSIVYKETITEPVIGVGHFEPLKHYAEVHILMEPLKAGQGIEIASELSEDILPINYQRLIMTHLEEKKYRGVLMGAELDDVRLTLINGRTHEKHTEGGDFREATYRAVRQGLMKAMDKCACRLLEPYYNFELTVPMAYAGRTMNDLSKLTEHFEGPEIADDEAVFSGRGPVSRLQGYGQEVLSYTGGFGRFSPSFGGYGYCCSEEEVLSEHFYDPETDISDPSGSVFCSHGAGYYVPWDEADSMMHLDVEAENKKYGITDDNAHIYRDSGILAANEAGIQSLDAAAKSKKADGSYDYLGAGLAGDRELESIWSSTTGRNINKEKADAKRTGSLMRENSTGKKKGDNRNAAASGKENKLLADPKQVLIVDGYNIIFAWEELNEMSRLSIDAARTMLADILSNYQGFKGMTLILVFDAYKVKGGTGSVIKYHNIYIVYTKEAQTADAYIEKTVHENAGNMRVTVATNDGLEQTIVFGDGASRMSARELYEAVRESSQDIRREYLDKKVRLENRISTTETL